MLRPGNTLPAVTSRSGGWQRPRGPAALRGRLRRQFPPRLGGSLRSTASAVPSRLGSRARPPTGSLIDASLRVSFPWPAARHSPLARRLPPLRAAPASFPCRAATCPGHGRRSPSAAPSDPQRPQLPPPLCCFSFLSETPSGAEPSVRRPQPVSKAAIKHEIALLLTAQQFPCRLPPPLPSPPRHVGSGGGEGGGRAGQAAAGQTGRGEEGGRGTGCLSLPSLSIRASKAAPGSEAVPGRAAAVWGGGAAPAAIRALHPPAPPQLPAAPLGLIDAAGTRWLPRRERRAPG